MVRIRWVSLVILMVLNHSMVQAEPVTVSVNVRNVPPSLSHAKVVLEEEALLLSFLVEESNTLLDLKRIVVSVYEVTSDGVVIQKYIWEGLGTDWTPKPIASLYPSESLSRSKGFLFSLTIMRKSHEGLIVIVQVSDKGQNQVCDEVILGI